jgi:hypothetical protein
MHFSKVAEHTLDGWVTIYLNRSAESETIRNFVEFCSICSQDPWKFIIKAPPFILAFLLQFGYDFLLLMDVNEGMGYEYSDKCTYIQKSSTRFTAKKVALEVTAKFASARAFSCGQNRPVSPRPACVNSKSEITQI